MTTAAKSSFGTFLKLGDGGATETFATIAEVKDIKGPAIKLETEDVTSHDSTDGWVERIGTLLDGGTVKFKLNWLPANNTQSFTNGLLKDLVGRTRRNFQLVVPAAASLTWAFSALVTEFNPDLPVKGAQTADLTLELTGKPTLA